MSAEPIYNAGGDSEEPGVNASTLRAELSHYLDLAKDGGRVYVTEGRSGRRVAALVPVEVAERDEQAEDEYWARRIADGEESGAVPWETALKELEGGQA